MFGGVPCGSNWPMELVLLPRPIHDSGSLWGRFLGGLPDVSMLGVMVG